VLSLANIRTYGKFLAASNDPLLDVQTAGDGEVLQLNLLGTAMARFDSLFPDATRQLFKDRFDLHVKRQPNSTTISRHGVNKGLCIQHLADLGAGAHVAQARYSGGKNYARDFQLRHAVAMGDHAAFTDFPLTQFPPMPFVNCSDELPPARKEWPYLAEMLEVGGGEEAGGARFLTAFVDACCGRAGEPLDKWFDGAFVREAAAKAKAGAEQHTKC